MSLTLRKKNQSFPSLVDDFFENDGLFPDLFNFNQVLPKRWSLNERIPSANIIENPKDFKIELAAPGLEKKDFKVEVNNGYLTISAEKEEEKKEDKKEYTRREFSYNAFSRSFQLPDNIDSDHIHAAYEDGILRLTVPKADDYEARPKKEIKVS